MAELLRFFPFHSLSPYEKGRYYCYDVLSPQICVALTASIFGFEYEPIFDFDHCEI